jgi:hypothetical protein
MGYRVAYRADDRQGAGPWVITQVLGSTTHLVVTLSGSTLGRPEVLSARIEQAYLTRHAGRKWRIVERLHAQDIELVPA